MALMQSWEIDVNAVMDPLRRHQIGKDKFSYPDNLNLRPKAIIELAGADL